MNTSCSKRGRGDKDAPTPRKEAKLDATNAAAEKKKVLRWMRKWHGLIVGFQVMLMSLSMEMFGIMIFGASRSVRHIYYSIKTIYSFSEFYMSYL